ncbi:hypothetical protein ABBQ38_006028 [Trebouxia sp. C0009 RCD-2024]
MFLMPWHTIDIWIRPQVLYGTGVVISSHSSSKGPLQGVIDRQGPLQLRSSSPPRAFTTATKQSKQFKLQEIFLRKPQEGAACHSLCLQRMSSKQCIRHCHNPLCPTGYKQAATQQCALLGHKIDTLQRTGFEVSC